MLKLLVLCIMLNWKWVNSRTIFPFHGQLENDSCLTFEQLNGKCTPINSCYAYRNFELIRSKPKICSWDLNELTVCCPNLYKRSVLLPTSSSPSFLLSILSNEWENAKNAKRFLFKCGLKRHFLPLYIVGGGPVQKGQWPWIVSIMKKNFESYEHICGGSIISEKYILTTAHCLVSVSDLSQLLIGIGSNRIETSWKIQVEDFIIHQDYLSDSIYNDIALIRLKKKLTFNEIISSICLPVLDSEEGLKAYPSTNSEVSIAGWGSELYSSSISSNLNEAKIKIVSRIKCNETYSKLKSQALYQGINEQFLCATSSDGTKDACQGDSGGPLVYYSPQKVDQEWDGKFYQLGIIAFGHQCGNKNFPGVYINVTYYLTWILKHISR